jgi:hypothetical protein
MSKRAVLCRTKSQRNAGDRLYSYFVIRGSQVQILQPAPRKLGIFGIFPVFYFFFGGNPGAIPNGPNVALAQFVPPAGMDLGRVILTGKPADVRGDARVIAALP